MSTRERDAGYEREFYALMHRIGFESAAIVLPLLFEYIRPRSVVDVGCGPGTWLSAFIQAGIDDVLGVDGPWITTDQLRIPAASFQVVDLATPLVLGRRFDLAVSLEVAEHLPAEAAETFIASLTDLAPVVLFSAAIPYQRGTNHLNEQWPGYWARLFENRGFRAIDCLRPRIWQNPDVDLCYAQNIYLAARADRLSEWPALAEAARHLPPRPLDMVHPRLYLETTAYAKPAKELFHAALGLLRDRLLGRDANRMGRRTDAGLPLAARWPVRDQPSTPPRRR